MEKKINLEEIFKEHIQPYRMSQDTMTNCCLKAMREAIKQALELAAENAETEKEILPECGVLKSVGVVNKQSILDTINQVK